MTKSRIEPTAMCPCGSAQHYARCCKPLHQGQRAKTPEALMRSRYSAYALGLVNYIMKTTHPDSPHYGRDRKAWQAELQAFCDNTTFIKLDVLAVDDGEDNDTGFVTFRASLLQGMQDVSFTERSLFKRHGSAWLYVSGVHS